MTKMLVMRDAQGKVINIGPWEFQVDLVEARDDEGTVIMDKATGVPYEHPDGTIVIDPETNEPHIDPATMRPLMIEVPHNLPPDGSYIDEADIVEGWDGGLYEVSDLARLGP